LVILLASREEGGVEQFVLHPEVSKRITANGAPLNRAQNQACELLSTTDDPETPGLTGFPTDVRLPGQGVIGLFDGGARYSCGIFHAAAQCTMRHETGDPDVSPNTEAISGEQQKKVVAPFCHVCRYIIVDQTDPTLHGMIDDLYKKNYPR
jgi:hypothetical protein